MHNRQGYNIVNTADSMDASVEDVAGLPSGLPSTHSSQQLVSTGSTSTVTRGTGLRSVSRSDWFTISVLCFVNLINYMDRFTIPGVLTDVQRTFDIKDDGAGLLQTVFILSYMVCAPIFGYLGDRYSRKLLMCVGVAIWSSTTLIGSFMQEYGWFITFRALVGVGEASYSTIAPTIISDLFVNDMRSKMLALFYFAIPVGSGLGYITGSKAAELLGSWQWALRLTPILGIIAVILIALIKEPIRGESEGSHHLESTSYLEDIKDLSKNRSFMLSTIGFTSVTFVAGALSFWGPKFILLGLEQQPGNADIKLDDVSFTFGAITMLSGIIGVPLGPYISQALLKRVPSIDPLLCAVGLFLSVPLLALAMCVVTMNNIATYVLIFFAELALNLNWAIVADILLYVVIPTRRSTAEAFQIFVSHTFGDAGSPYLIGVLSEMIKTKIRQSDFHALQYSLFTTCFVEVIGGVFFLLTALYIVKDKKRTMDAIKGCSQELSESPSSSEASVNLIKDGQPDAPSHMYADVNS